MASVLRSILPGSSAKKEDHDDDYSVDYSFAIEYSGPPLSFDIPHVVPVDVRRIPKAAVAAMAATVSNLSLPIIQPIVKKSDLGKSVVYSKRDGAQSSSSSDTLGFSDGHSDSNQLSYSSGVEDIDNDNKAIVSYNHNNNSSSKNSNSVQDVEASVAEVSNQMNNRTSIVTFCDLPDSTSEETDHDEPATIPEKPIVSDDVKKGVCHKCHKRNRFGEKEVCIVCGAKYCRKCVIRAMGAMPEGRKCMTCTGYGIDESKRGSLGKCSRMLKKLLTEDGVKQILHNEVSCGVNQLPPYRICVNDKPLSTEELVRLQGCSNPPKNLKPGKYWYDKVSGFWGKDGEKPSQIISAQLAVGYQIRQDASNGNTNVLINNREITKAELWMLQAAKIPCEGNPHFWITADGECQHEGMNFIMGKLWEKKHIRLVCAALSLPFPSKTLSRAGEDVVDEERAKVNQNNLEQKTMNKLLLVGSDQSGTSTIYKQAKILYKNPFSEDEKQNIKIMIQRNLYRYIGILLEARERFQEDEAIELRRRFIEEPGPSDISNLVAENNVYSFSPRLEYFSSWLLQVMNSGNLEAIFPAATRENSPLVEELWKDKGFQAVYKRRNEIQMLPRVANYFLDRAVEISQVDYEPSEMDVFYAEGINPSNGVASMDFSFPKSSQDEYMELVDQNDTSASYQLIRVHASSHGVNLKWLQMFEDVNLVLFSISLTDYDEYYEDINGERTNKMSLSKKLFENIVSHPALSDKHFLLILNKFDLLEKKIEHAPLKQCDWFQDFNPVISFYPNNANSNSNPSLALRAFHYVAVKFKRLFNSLTGRKLFVSRATGLEADTVDKVFRYGKEILKWDDDRNTVSMNEWSSESIEPSTSV